MRVLIVRVGAMGDVLHALPAVATLRRARPDWTIDWVVDERWAPLLVGGPVVDRVFTATVKAWSAAPLAAATFASIRELRGSLRGQTYDVAVDMQGTIRSAVIGRMAAAGRLVGFEDPREAPAKRLYGERVARTGVHVVEQGAELLGAAVGVGLSLEGMGDFLPVDASAESWAEGFGSGFCVMAPSAGWGAKQWPAERFGDLARLLAERGISTLVNAVRADDALAARVVAASGGTARVVACGIAELTSLLRRAAVYVGGDSGPTHLAAALGVPVVGLYGPTDPARNGPWGSGVVRVLRDAGSVTSHKRVEEVEVGLGRMGVEEVLEAVVRVLEG